MEFKLYISWQAHDTRRWHSVGVLQHQPGQGYEFGYIRGALRAQRESGFSGISSFPDFYTRYRSDKLFAFFSNRILSTTRPEYRDLIAQVGLQPVGDKDSADYVFDFLRRTRGWRATDSFEMFAPVEQIESGYRWQFFTRGLRYTPEVIQSLWVTGKPKEPLQIASLQNNPADENAMVILDQCQTSLGYIPRNYSATIRSIVDAATCVEFEIMRHNQPEDLVQKRFLLELRTQMPAGFELPHFDEFDSLSDDAAVA